MEKIVKLSFLMFGWLILFADIKVYAVQDTIRLTKNEAEFICIERNLSLMASYYGVEAAKAQIIQARVIDNPNFYFEQNIFNSINNRWFDFGKQGESVVEIEQLIKLAGQRRKNIRLQTVNAKIAELETEECARNILLELKKNFTECYYLDKSIGVFDREIYEMKRIVDVYSIQQGKGNVSVKEVLRLKALLFSLENERLGIVNNRFELNGKIKVLLNTDKDVFIVPLIDESVIDYMDFSGLDVEGLLNYIERPDIEIAKSNVEAEQLNLKLQKAYAVPDLAIKGIYDKAGSFINNYFAIGLSIDIPVFNTNRGNIKVAQRRRDELFTQLSNLELMAREEVMTALNKLFQTYDMYKSYDAGIEYEFNKMIKGVTDNFENRNIGLLEFVDYYESYKDMALGLFDLKRKLYDCIDDFNYFVGRDIL